jgi:uncharacterized protein YlaN (UPF0358 family)
MNFIITLNNELLDLKEEKNKLLRLKANTINQRLKISQDNILLAYDTSIHILDTKIKKLQKAIAIRFRRLLSWDQHRIFCEVRNHNNDNDFTVDTKSVTPEPINQLGTRDLNRNFITLNRIKSNKISKTLQVSTVIIDLRTGEIYDELNSHHRDMLINKRILRT